MRHFYVFSSLLESFLVSEAIASSVVSSFFLCIGSLVVDSRFFLLYVLPKKYDSGAIITREPNFIIVSVAPLFVTNSGTNISAAPTAYTKAVAGKNIRLIPKLKKYSRKNNGEESAPVIIIVKTTTVLMMKISTLLLFPMVLLSPFFLRSTRIT